MNSTPLEENIYTGILKKILTQCPIILLLMILPLEMLLLLLLVLEKYIYTQEKMQKVVIFKASSTKRSHLAGLVWFLRTLDSEIQ